MCVNCPAENVKVLITFFSVGQNVTGGTTVFKFKFILNRYSNRSAVVRLEVGGPTLEVGISP